MALGTTTLHWENLDNENQFYYYLSNEAKLEIHSWLNQLTSWSNYNDSTIDLVRFPFFNKDIEKIKALLKKNIMVIIKKIDGLQPFHIIQYSFLVSKLIGEPLVQNLEQDRIVKIFDRKQGSMKDGARYHQTSDGGSIHTDNVNLSEPWEIMLLASISNAPRGGESLLISAQTVYDALKLKSPKSLEILKKNFHFERRGIDKNNSIYQAPILSFNQDGVPNFRYLRDYIESAYERVNDKLTSNQLNALNVLDEVLHDQKNQFELSFNVGDIPLMLDNQIFHGRKKFIDEPNTINIDEYLKDPSINKKISRTFLRVWIKERNSHS